MHLSGAPTDKRGSEGFELAWDVKGRGTVAKVCRIGAPVSNPPRHASYAWPSVSTYAAAALLVVAEMLMGKHCRNIDGLSMHAGSKRACLLQESCPVAGSPCTASDAFVMAVPRRMDAES